MSGQPTLPLLKPTVFLSATLRLFYKVIFSTLFPFSLPYSGVVYKGSGTNGAEGISGFFWASGAISNIYARRLEFGESNIYTEPDTSYKVAGLSVRRNIKHYPPSTFPFSLPYSGNVGRDSGANVSQGSGGYFWSPGANSATNARGLNFNGVHVWPELDGYKTYGFSVRCVKKTISYTFFPFSLPYSGRVNRVTGEFDARGSSAYFWSAGAYSATNARYLVFNDVYVWPESTNATYKTAGFSVRCAKKRAVSRIYPLQVLPSMRQLYHNLQHTLQHSHSRFRTQEI